MSLHNGLYNDLLTVTTLVATLRTHSDSQLPPLWLFFLIHFHCYECLIVLPPDSFQNTQRLFSSPLPPNCTLSTSTLHILTEPDLLFSYQRKG